jgi:diguanylate cyclase (GGDEF)-like protein
MKRLIPFAAIVLGWAVAAQAAAPAPLTTLRDLHALSNDQAKQALPVAFEATVTYFRSYEKTLFVQDGTVAIFVLATTGARLVPGDRVLIKGTTQDSFRPIVISSDITLLRHGVMPTPVPATYDDLIRARHDCMLVSVRAKVRAADLVISSGLHGISLQLLTDGGAIDATVDSDDTGPLEGLLDAEVEIVGPAAGRFDGKMQQTGILIHVSSWADITVLEHSAANPASLPVTPMDQIITGYREQVLSERMKVNGTITYYQPGSAVVLQSGSKSLWVQTHTIAPMSIGDLAEATGFPGLHDGFLTLTNSTIQDSRVQAPIAPQAASWFQLTLSGHVFDMVSIEGQVVTEVREAAQDEYVLVADGQMFSAIYRHPPLDRLVSEQLPPMKQVAPGSRIRVTGICMLDDSNPFDSQVPFTILIRSFDDITVIAQPSWLNIRNLMFLVGFLLIVVFAGGAKGWSLERKVRRQTAALAARTVAEAALERRMAQIEQRRSRILEDINGSRPLTEILEQIIELVSFGLRGAPCWCEIADGARLGSHPPAPESLRIVCEPLPARAGAPLGTLSAAFDCGTQPSDLEAEALSVGARLATLAIETRRIYSDLLHRSEFDRLTDLHNRFSLDQHLEAQIQQARLNGGIFGLIYIDLDGFKQVNDLYGHRVGDLYLQEVALRMKRQLRSHDLLARLGGDEFAALVAVIPNREGAGEIAERLESCFNEPFYVEGYILRGSASLGVALYPDDGATRDSLLCAADAAMYVAKHAHRDLVEMASSHGSTPRGLER